MKKISIVIFVICMFGISNACNSMVFAMGSKPPEKGVEQAEQAEQDATDAKATDEMQRMQQNADEARKIVVAKVNGDPVSMYNLIRMMNKMAPKYVKSGENITPEITDKVKKDALDRLILQELAIQAAVKQGIEIKPEKIDKVVNKVKEGLGTEEAYKAYLDKFGFTEESFRVQIERGHRLEIITKKEIYGKVKVDPKDIEKEYKKNKAAGKLRMKESFVVKDVLLMKGEDETVTRKRAEKILAEINNNQKKIDKGEIKRNADAIGQLVLDGTFITRRLTVTKERNPEMHKKMTKMKVGEMSGVVKDKDSYHIFRVIEKEPARDQTLEEASGFIENRLRVPAQNARKAAFEEELKKDAQIEILLDEVEKQLKERAGKSKTEG